MSSASSPAKVIKKDKEIQGSLVALLNKSG